MVKITILLNDPCIVQDNMQYHRINKIPCQYWKNKKSYQIKIFKFTNVKKRESERKEPVLNYKLYIMFPNRWVIKNNGIE